ncbi:synaptotagmin-6 [Engraulis encrasicolus]|uniref:synaptotagmin-6 n=1 Tax=Engraulis encrasicolus TaxID=184585 RepID=UPI002FD6C267
MATAGEERGVVKARFALVLMRRDDWLNDGAAQQPIGSCCQLDLFCERAVTLIVDLCLDESPLLDTHTCQDFLLMLTTHTHSPQTDQRVADLQFSLLLLLFCVCGVALLGVVSLASWKLCWLPWRQNIPPDSASAALALPAPPLEPPYPAPNNRSRPFSMADERGRKDSGSFLEAAVKISHTSPDIPAEVQLSMKEHLLRRTRISRQTTEPASSNRHSSFKKHLPRQMHHVSSLDAGGGDFLEAGYEARGAGLGSLRPELYCSENTKSGSGGGSSGNGGCEGPACGKINFSLHYDHEGEQLCVRIIRALDLPAKDLCGSSDPYVKIYLLPDRKRKFQTRVHRKTLNPTFDESFLFPVVYDELGQSKLHLSVFDFDRFSRHDMIGEVVMENLFEESDLSRETSIWRDIQYATSESVDLGEIMFSLCYLPTAGRLTLTVIKCRNLKAMDITGYSDPYVKVSLMCDGRRLKKKKTSTKKNTLNPAFNEAIIFDIPPENMDQVSLHISVMDYDLVGHNEVIGVNRVGSRVEGLGRDHWNEMLAYPRKPITHWHSLLEPKKTEKEWKARTASFDSQGSCPSPRLPSSP